LDDPSSGDALADLSKTMGLGESLLDVAQQLTPLLWPPSQALCHSRYSAIHAHFQMPCGGLRWLLSVPPYRKRQASRLAPRWVSFAASAEWTFTRAKHWVQSGS